MLIIYLLHSYPENIYKKENRRSYRRLDYYALFLSNLIIMLMCPAKLTMERVHLVSHDPLHCP